MWRTLLLLSLLSCCLAGSSSGTTYLVRPDGTGDYPTIQAAVTAAHAGDIIELADGTFTGNGNRDVSYLGKGITIRSRSGDPTRCVIDCEGSAQGSHRGFLFTHSEGSSAALEGVTVARAYSIWGGGIHCMGPTVSPRITNCIFTGNASPGSEGGGICTESDAFPLITNCVFYGNSAACGGGLSVTNGMGTAGPTVVGCTFYDNYASSDGGGVRL